jgi:hypothetical protein
MSEQTRQIDLPADSNFAVAMQAQQQAEKEEQRRIKNLVLNYDLTTDENDGANGESNISYLLQPNLNKTIDLQPLHPARFSWSNRKINTSNISSELKDSRNNRSHRTRRPVSTRQGTTHATNVPGNYS